MQNNIFITGAGIVSAIGIGIEETLASLLARKTGIGQMRYLPSCHRHLPVGEVKLSNDEMMRILGTHHDIRLTRSALMGRLALREALQSAHLSPNSQQPTANSQCSMVNGQWSMLNGQCSMVNGQCSMLNVHFVSATTVGGMDRRELFRKDEPSCDKLHAAIATHHCVDCTEMVAQSFPPFASMATISTACSSATNAIITAANMLRCRLADIVIAGGTECLTLFHLNGFNALMILDHQQCKPFDRERAGLNLGEGAAYLVLETAASARQRGVNPLCQLSGYGNACDAFHQTASSPEGEGAYLAMQQALKMAHLKPSDIQYINAHGTGTPNNDQSESCAIRRVFRNVVPPVSSTKSFTGHTTSASGSIEAVFCMLALQRQFLPVNLNWHTPMDNGILPVTDSQPKEPLRHVMSNAFGFGGNDSSLILSKV